MPEVYGCAHEECFYQSVGDSSSFRWRQPLVLAHFIYFSRILFLKEEYLRASRHVSE